jgi:hypothetical protein
MAVHDVEVNPIRFGFLDAARFGGNFAEVSRKQRGRNNHPREAKVFLPGVKQSDGNQI